MIEILIGVAAACTVGAAAFALLALAMWADERRNRPAPFAGWVPNPVPDVVPWGLEVLTGELTDTIPDN